MYNKEETNEVVIKVMAEKIRMLEWQLKNAEDGCAKLRAVNEQLKKDFAEKENRE